VIDALPNEPFDAVPKKIAMLRFVDNVIAGRYNKTILNELNQLLFSSLEEVFNDIEQR
jgi:hypothetical protein